eukprot:TRINITY_DN11796_c0_g1_i1.p1 TRINITY_DN11796_c0_g1~~TRINITY_DN11796_c0_g1_i1.p1  ORF type:complete len:142 (-),score=21.95 TRINITY_DN11796_c0_g1_i1:108-476(-)
MGDDFEYEAAESWFTNLDALINFLRANPEDYGEINAFYSTPAEYIKAVKAEGIPDITTKHGDFYPYADNADSYWTGYFTSRPAFKGYDTGNRILSPSLDKHWMYLMGVGKETSRRIFGVTTK